MQLGEKLIKVAGQLPAVSGIGPVYLVGGSLRDLILDRPFNDYDFAVHGNARAFARKVATKLGVHAIEMGKDDKTVYRIISGGKVLDFSPMHGKSIDEDLKRRDFTVNSLGFVLSSESPPGRGPLRSGGLIDPVGGLKDIRSKTIRLISEDAILVDPLRMVRAFRLAAVLGFEIAPQTLSVIKEHSALVARSARERIRAELFKTMEAKKSFPYIEQMCEAGILMKLFPELELCRNCLLNDHGYDVLRHVMRTYKEIEIVLGNYATLWPEYAEPIRSYLEHKDRKVLLKWAALLHDVGKPATRSLDPTGRLRFLGHETKGAHIVRALCLRLRMSVRERSFIESVVQNHLHPLLLFDARQRGALTARGIIRFVTRHKDDIVGLLLHSVADQRAKAYLSIPACNACQPRSHWQEGGPIYGKPAFQPGHNLSSETVGHESDEEFKKAFVEFLKEILQRYFSDLKPTMTASRLITGKDLIEHFGLTPSELFGKLLQSVEEARLSQEIRTREEAFELVAKLLYSQKRMHRPKNAARGGRRPYKPDVAEVSD
ncbi:MAG: hypothetical protein BA861_02000 [Desulfobacterales bacterium S3730MH5]|nr:MAG: hypothetical protein BA861_02000 [Desulfobacterales bacterium S3730MH5]